MAEKTLLSIIRGFAKRRKEAVLAGTLAAALAGCDLIFSYNAQTLPDSTVDAAADAYVDTSGVDGYADGTGVDGLGDGPDPELGDGMYDGLSDGAGDGTYEGGVDGDMGLDSLTDSIDSQASDSSSDSSGMIPQECLNTWSCDGNIDDCTGSCTVSGQLRTSECTKNGTRYDCTCTKGTDTYYSSQAGFGCIPCLNSLVCGG
jgi:hypothetical protein